MLRRWGQSRLSINRVHIESTDASYTCKAVGIVCINLANCQEIPRAKWQRRAAQEIPSIVVAGFLRAVISILIVQLLIRFSVQQCKFCFWTWRESLEVSSAFFAMPSAAAPSPKPFSKPNPAQKASWSAVKCFFPVWCAKNLNEMNMS